MATFIAAAIDSGSQPLYQWMVNGTLAAIGTSKYTSSTIRIEHIPNVVSSLNITASANDICRNSTVVFTSLPVNSGNDPSYTWLVNGLPAGKDTPTYVSRDLHNGDIVTAVMTTGLKCSKPVTSNAIPMTVYEFPRIELTSDTIIAAGSQATLHPTIAGPYDSFSWTSPTYINAPYLLHPTVSPSSTTVWVIEYYDPVARKLLTSKGTFELIR
jgi:hypothetical protein